MDADEWLADSNLLRGSMYGVPGFLGFYLSALGNHLRDATNAALAPLSLNTRKVGVLSHLADHASSSQRELGRALRMDRTTIMLMIEELRMSGAIEVMPGSDARMHALRLTRGGRVILRQATTLARAEEDRLLKSLDAEKQKQVLDALAEMVKQLGPYEP